ncbi:SCP domain-containing protein [Pseudozyma hubeiensis]|nr:SCP domain-containing protein [Pseudozyma hubeiensis]
MKVTTALVAVVGTLALFAPLSSASQPVVERDSVAISNNEWQPRGTSCKVSARANKKPQHRNKKKKKGSPKKVVVAAKAKTTQRKTSTKHPSSTKKPTFVTSKVVAATGTKAKAVTPTASSAASGSTSGATGSSGSLSSFASTILSIHNTDRAKHSASPLTWSPTLASAAASWAAKCQWGHTPNNPYGQNIAAGTATDFGAKDATDLWYDEISQYDFSKGEYSDATGHFTQMVWKSSKQLGCALQKCSGESLGFGSGSGEARYVVCNYDPPGNYIGRFKENVSQN